MDSSILPEEETSCDFKDLQSTMDPDSLVDSLRVSLESCEPFSVTDPDPFNSLGQPDISWTDTLVGPLNSIVMSESSELRDRDGKDHNRFNDACERKVTEVTSSSTRRSARKSKYNQKIDAELAARKHRTTVCMKKPLLDLLLVNVGRRQRSDLAKRGRVSTWGLVGSINEVFEQNAEKNVIKNEHIASKKGMNGRRSGKRNNNVVNQSIENSGGESQVSKRGIRVKFKLGNKAIQSCQFNIAPVIKEDLESDKEVKVESSNLPSDIKDEYEEQVPCGSMSQSFNEVLDKVVMRPEGSVVDVLPVDKDKIEDSVVKGGNNIPKMIGVGETVENRCLDPGTSPDSEVIDVIPETHVSGIAAEGSHDVQIPSKDFVAHKTGDCGVASGLPSPDIIDDVLSSDKCGVDEKIRDDSCASVAYISKTTVVTSRNAFSRERCPMEPMASLQETEIGVPLEMLKIASERQPELSLGIGLEPVDSQDYEKSLFDGKFNGQKLQKSSRSRGTNKSKTEVPDPVNKRKAKSRHKGLHAKSNVKGKNKEKNGNQATCEMDPETGNCEADDIIQLTEGCQISAGASSNSPMVPSEGDNHDGQPRNAWVCCDDCHKWRRIPAILADSIESTECRWICKDNMDKDFADCSIPQEKSNAEINEELEISDASCEEDACETRLNANRLGQKQPRDPPESSWKLIRTNLFLHRNRKNQTVDEIMVCHCKPPTDGRRGCRDGCLNRMLNIECVKGTCPCGELCSNQQFQKRNYAKLKCFRCGKKGYGLQLLEDIPKGRFLIEYVGEVLDMPSYDARQREYAAKGHKHFYFMTLNGSEVIDACAKGNLGRFINHSCEPNCRTEKWMVNGEVCIGLFAIRDIKKGEELTFDYNYVRVFGAAAKKCVCGSSRCRGFIGGDPLNAETVVLGDSDEEYPEPVMLYDSGDKLENIFSGIGSFDSAGIQTAEINSNGGEREKVATVAEHLENAEKEESPDSLMEIDDKNDISTTASGRLGVGPDNDVSFERSSYAASESECKIEDADGLLPYSVQPLHTSLQPNDGKSETTSIDSLDHYAAEEDAKGWFSTGERTKTSLGSSASHLLAHIVDTKRKTKSHLDDNICTVLKPHSRTKISRPSSSVKRGKPINIVVNVPKPPKIEKTLIIPQKTKRLVEDALNGRFEAVQETLNALLNADGGISKRRDASKGYLKLLFLTAASGDSGNGEGIQSNRDLSMILDALLKTKSRTVLLDVINKNGLQMLHNIMKRYRREFNKIPILRKLLKVLEYLAEAGILTLENILKPPSCLGAESFRQSMLLLTEHTDKQVHQIARNFRDRWIPRSFRRINLVEKDVEMMESQRSSKFGKSKTSQNPSSDQDRRASEVVDNCVKQSFSAHMPPADGRSLEGSSASCVSTCITDGTRSRKRKSRWDMPGDVNADIGSPSNKESRLMTGGKEEVKDLSHVMHEERLTTDEDGDAPPGFSSPINCQVLVSHASSTFTESDHVKAVIAYPQERFTSQLSTSYGVPSSTLKQVGAIEGVTAESWVVAPAVTFHPFPPLPSYPRGDNSMNHPVEREQSWRNHADATWSNPTTSSTSPTNMPISGPYNQNNFQRFRNSNRLGRRYFKQQKWNHSRPGLPWNTNKNGYGGFIGANNSKLGVRYGGNEANGSYNTGVVSSSNEAYGNNLSHQPQH